MVQLNVNKRTILAASTVIFAAGLGLSGKDIERPSAGQSSKTVASQTIDPQEEKIAHFLSAFQKSRHLHVLEKQSGAIALVHKNQVIYRNFFGVRRSPKKPRGASREVSSVANIDATTLFPLASVTKPITAALVASLVKQRILSYDDPIQSAIPGIPGDIQLRHILSHSSGFYDPYGNSKIQKSKSHEEVIHSFDGRPPDHTVGTHYFYSNVFFAMVQDLIEKKTGQTFTRNMADFLAAIGISGAEVCGLSQPNLVAYPHNKVGHQLIPLGLPTGWVTRACPAAGLYLTLDQLALFANVMLGHHPKILNQTDFVALIQPQVEVTDIFKKWIMHWPYPIRDLRSAYGLGWRLLERKSSPDPKLIFHSGHLNGITSFIGILPQQDLGIVVLSNQDAEWTEPVGMDFWKLARRLIAGVN